MFDPDHSVAVPQQLSQNSKVRLDICYFRARRQSRLTYSLVGFSPRLILDMVIRERLQAFDAYLYICAIDYCYIPYVSTGRLVSKFHLQSADVRPLVESYPKIVSIRSS